MLTFHSIRLINSSGTQPALLPGPHVLEQDGSDDPVPEVGNLGCSSIIILPATDKRCFSGNEPSSADLVCSRSGGWQGSCQAWRSRQETVDRPPTAAAT